jgi:antitoxin (DNA-binding transcriptional repressor) of toxin-antitoxin stability system
MKLKLQAQARRARYFHSFSLRADRYCSNFDQTRSNQIDWSKGEKMYVDTISEAKTQLSALIEKVIAGEEIIIKKAGVPVALLKKYEADAKKRHPGVLKGEIHISDDFETLPDELLEAFQGK